MKKRYLVLAALLLVAVTAAGCGKKKTDDTTQDAQVTVVPAQDTDTSDANSGALVDMQESTDADIKNVIGDKTDTASKLILVNETGDDIAQLYIRPTSDEDDEWGEDLINGLFTLKDGDKALYYYDKDVKDSEGNAVTSFDIRIVYTDENLSECYFRKLPLLAISQITLRMDGTGDDSIPYATYITGSSKQEVSTLNDVKKRLGLDDSSSDDSQDDGDGTSGSETPDPTATPDPSNVQPTAAPDPDNHTDASADQARQYIGQPLSSLTAALGDANGSDYENEPETGETGYHYYDTFTVSTTVDESGNEVVAQVW